MGRYLVIANQTLGGEDLDNAIRERIDQGPSVFYVVVPMTQVRHEVTSGWTGGFAFMDAAASFEAQRQAMEAAARHHEAEEEGARQRAEFRLNRMIAKIESLGGEAEGEVGTHDPLDATASVLDRQAQFDGIIVSTLPAGLSRWLKMDVPSRISRMTDVPVTTVEATPTPVDA